MEFGREPDSSCSFAASKLDDRPKFSSNQLRTSFEPASVMEFGFNETVIHKFYVAANAVYSHVKFASVATVLFLFETHCLPFLSYASEALNYSKHIDPLTYLLE